MSRYGGVWRQAVGGSQKVTGEEEDREGKGGAGQSTGEERRETEAVQTHEEGVCLR